MTNNTLKVGDKVRILDASRIMLGSRFFSDGDITEVVSIRRTGSPAIKTHGGDTDGLVLLSDELYYVEKVEGKVVEFMPASHYRKGDTVRILDAAAIMFGARYWSNGDLTTVTSDVHSGYGLQLSRGSSDDDGLVIKDEELGFIEKVERPIVEAVPSVVERTTHTRVLELESQVAKLEAKVLALETGNVDTHTSMFEGKVSGSTLATPPVFTHNMRRAATIERAKAFVVDVTRRMDSHSVNFEGNSTFQIRTTKPYFTTKDRTTTVVVKGANYPEEYERASATAAPGDVLNVHIGQAIALGRALGLDVSEFVKAPQPTEVVVGMQVTNSETSYWGTGKVRRLESASARSTRGYWVGESKDDSYNYLRTAIILEDTNALYESEAK